MHSYFNTSRAYLPHNSSKIEGWRRRITTQLQTFSTQVTLSLSLLSDCFYLWHGALALILSTAQLAFFFFFLFLFYPFSLSLSLSLSCLTASISGMVPQLSFSQKLNSAFFFFFLFLFYFPPCFIIYNVKYSKASIPCMNK